MQTQINEAERYKNIEYICSFQLIGCERQGDGHFWEEYSFPNAVPHL